jgi:hypothetical protein
MFNPFAVPVQASFKVGNAAIGIKDHSYNRIHRRYLNSRLLFAEAMKE